MFDSLESRNDMVTEAYGGKKKIKTENQNNQRIHLYLKKSL
jgi:hypothetical protein